MTNNPNLTVHWSTLVHEGWQLHLAATEKGLCYVGSPNQPLSELADWASARLPGCSLIGGDDRLRPYWVELAKYLQGALRGFTIPFDLHGTPFQQEVWDALCRIPYGKTVSYTDIAAHIGKPSAVRAVGAAIGANPVLIAVPCHRVIGKNGALTGYRGGMIMKKNLLHLERNGHETGLFV